MKKKLMWLAGFVFISFALMLVTKVPALGLDKAEFCGQCHVMDEQVDTYLHSAHRLGATCGDCHIPHSLVYGATYKAYTGTRDIVAVVTDTAPKEIRVTKLGQDILQENCLRCHGQMLEQVGDTKRDGGRYCFDCHRSTPHQK